MNTTQVNSTTFDKLKRRIVKILRYGKADVQTPIEAAPYGTDSNPIKDMVAIYAPTSSKGQNIIIGYLNKNQLADVGEHRIYATNADGDLKTYVWLKANGTVLLAGDADNLVRYQKLNTALSQHNTQVLTELGKIATAIAGLGGVYTVGAVQMDIAQAKIDELKCP